MVAAAAGTSTGRRGGNSVTDSPPAVLQVPTNAQTAGQDQGSTMSSMKHGRHGAQPPPTSSSSSSPSSSSDAYALVRTGPALALPPDADGGGGDGGGACGGGNGQVGSSTQRTVQSIYESYSLRYPNPAVLADRSSEADRLADEERGRGEASGGDGGGGFFSRLFGGGRAKTPTGADTASSGASDAADRGSSGDATGQQEEDAGADSADERSVSMDEEELRKEEQEAELGRYRLCGTDAFAVGGIIPPEAHRAARFQLASSSLGADLAASRRQQEPRRRRQQQPKEGTLRICRTGNVASYGVVSIVVGWGQIADFHRVPKSLEQVEEGGGTDEDGYEQQPSFSLTSDADLLLPSIAAYERYTSPSGSSSATASTGNEALQPDLRLVRAAALGPNCLAISWGCRDGIVVLYRRSRSEKTGMRWDAVGCIEPNMSVVDAAASSATLPPDAHIIDARSGGRKKRKGADGEKDRGAQQQPRVPSPFALDSMRVTDLVPMVLEDDESGNNSTVLLAMSRLGGYIELVPIPTDLCRGPIIKSQSTPKRKGGGSGTGGSQPEHYAASLPVLRVPSAAAISTSAYHRDIAALDVHRTVVSATTEWDCDARPDAPPVEFLLAASGASIEGEGECVSLWGVASVYSAPKVSNPRKDGADALQHQEQTEMEFSIYVGLVGISDPVNVGSPISVFASDVTTAQWYHRPERNVRRRISIADDVGRASVASATEGSGPQVFSISTLVPFTALQFSPCESNQSSLLLCGLDYNGGITVLDCTAAHQIAIHEALPPTRPTCDSPGNETGPELGIVALDVLRSRESMIDWTDNPGGAVIQAGWWWPDPDENTEEYTSQQSEPLLMTFSSDGELNAYALDIFADESTNTETGRIAFQGDITMEANLDESVSIHNSIRFSASSLDSGPFGFLVLSSTTDLSSSSPSAVQRKLAPCAVQTVDPAKLIHSLMDQGQNREAIEMTRRLAGFSLSPEVMDICFKALWTDEFDADALIQVSDAHYVIQAARSLGDQFSKASRESRRMSVTLDQVLKIYRCAIEMATPHSNAFYDKAVQHLRSNLVKAGTYTLLSQHFGGDARKLKAERFFSTFLRPGAILDIALSFAKRGDVPCLTLLIVRHFDEIGSNQSRGQILAQLPLGLSVREYSHLLPIHENKSGGIFSYDDNEKGPSTNLQSWRLASLLQNDDDKGMTLYLDDQDKLMTVDQMRSCSIDCDDDNGNREASSFDLAQWFGERAQQIHTLSGLLDPAVDLCSFGLNRLHKDDPGRQRLSSFCATAYHLNQIISDETLLLKGEASSLSIASFAGLGLQGAVRLVLSADTAAGDGDIAETMIARYRKILEPMILSDDVSLRMHLWSSNDDGDFDSSQNDAIQTRMQNEITSFCIANLHNESSGDAKSLGRSLEVCRAFADASKTAIPKKERIIRNENVLVKFVLQVAYSPQISISRTTLDTLWGLYECLPVRVKSWEISDEQWAKLSSTIDTYYRHLLVFEIGLRWCLKPQFLGTLYDMRQSKEMGGSSIEFGCKILAAMSDTFCKRIKSLRSNEQEENEAILDFLSDLQEMNDMCFDSALPVGAELENDVVRTLLYQHSFRALRIIISTKNDWFDDDVVQGAVSEFVLEIMAPADDSIGSSSDSDEGRGSARGDLLRAAIECQDVFGPIFPKLRQEFDASRRYLDVAHFVHDVLGCKLEPVNDTSNIVNGKVRQGSIASLSRFQSTPPIQIIDAVLRENPGAILLGGSDWSDATFASQANFNVACFFERIDAPLDPSDSSGPPDASSLPPPPGGYIMQLSNILGLGENSMVARAKMAQHGAAAGFFGASSAICFLLLRDISMTEKDGKPIDDSEVESSLLEAIGTIVSSDSYSDVRMKRELCILSMRHLSVNVSKSGFERKSFDKVLRAFPELEAKFSPLNLVQSGAQVVAAAQSFDSNEGQHMGDSLPHHTSGSPMPPPPQQEQTSQFLVFKAAGMISRQAKKVVNEVKKSGDIVHHPSADGSHGGSHLSAVLAPSISDTANAYGQIFSSTSTNVHELMTRLQSRNNGTAGLSSSGDDFILKGLARNILSWCAFEAGKANPRTSNQVAKMLQFGSALLLELTEGDRLGILDDVERILVAEASSSASIDFAGSSLISVKPDDALVRRLCGRGYSLNGARRAAVMTNNADFNAALTWCVTHFQDPDFNEPVLVLKSNEPLSTNHQLIGMVKKAIAESRRGPPSVARAPSTEVQPQQSGRTITASIKRDPFSSTDKNEGGFSFGWDDDEDIGDLLEDDDKVPVVAPALGSAAMSSKKALPVCDAAEASSPQPPKVAEKLEKGGWDGFDDLDDMLNDEDKGTPPVDTIESAQSDGRDVRGKQNLFSTPESRSIPNVSMSSKPDDAPIPRNLHPDSSPTASNHNVGDGGGWDEDDGFDNFDDMLKEKYGEEDESTHQETKPAPVPASSPTGIKSNDSEVSPLPPSTTNATESNVVPDTKSLPPPPTPPTRPPPAQPKIAATQIESPIRFVREQAQLLSQEERKRLAEEGRRLLREKRLERETKPLLTAAVSSTSSVSRPTTRSMTSRANTTGTIASSAGASNTPTTSSRPTAGVGRSGTVAKITDPSERERLIMEGRRLLMEARKAKQKEASTGVTPKPKLKPRPPPTPPPRPASSASPGPPPERSMPPASGAEDDNWDDFDKF